MYTSTSIIHQFIDAVDNDTFRANDVLFVTLQNMPTECYFWKRVGKPLS